MVKAGTKLSAKQKTLGQGAATTIYAALSPETADGAKCVFKALFDSYLTFRYRFCDDGHLAETAPYAVDPDDARRLWEMSEKMVGL